MRRRIVARGAQLALTDSGGEGQPVLFLHGLAGYRGEWRLASSALRGYRCLALDLRGHGDSERRPVDLSPRAQIEDVKTVVDEVVGGTVHLIGQSFGGHIAFLVAAAHPLLLRSLIVVEASPERPPADSLDRLRQRLESWPRPFRSREQALSFFGGGTRAEAWVEGLAERDDGLWPRFDTDTVMLAMTHIASRSWWDEWTRIRCRTLVAQGAHGDIAASDVLRMTHSGPHAEVVSIPSAGHDAHLDNPSAFGSAVRAFLSQVP